MSHDDTTNQHDQSSAQHADPSVNDVLAQQMGTEYTEVEPHDKQQLQRDLTDQGTKPEDIASDNR